jgi:hypothetical protein
MPVRPGSVAPVSGSWVSPRFLSQLKCRSLFWLLCHDDGTSSSSPCGGLSVILNDSIGSGPLYQYARDRFLGSYAGTPGTQPEGRKKDRMMTERPHLVLQKDFPSLLWRDWAWAPTPVRPGLVSGSYATTPGTQPDRARPDDDGTSSFCPPEGLSVTLNGGTCHRHSSVEFCFSPLWSLSECNIRGSCAPIFPSWSASFYYYT